MTLILKRTENPINRIERQGLNDNWTKIENNFNNVIDVASESAFEKVVDSAKLIWQAPVNAFADLTTTYPNAEVGWAAWTREVIGGVSKAYRYNGTQWVEQQQFLGDAINEVDNRLTLEIERNNHLVLSNKYPTLQAAVNALNIGTKKTLYITEGDYTLTSQLLITSNDCKIVMSKGARITVLNNYAPDAVIRINANNVSLENISLYGDSDNQKVVYGVSVGQNYNNIQIKDCYFSGFTGGIIFVNNNNNLEVDNCKFYNMTYVPSVVAGGYGVVYQKSFNAKTTNCYFDKTVKRHHIYLSKFNNESIKGSNFVVSNNIFDGNLDANETYITGFEFQLKFLDVDNVSVTGNTFSGGVGNIWFTGQNENISIVGNTFTSTLRNNGGTSACIGSEAVGAYVEGLTISGNSFNRCNVLSHIRLIGGKNVNISDCTVNNPVNGHFVLTESNLINSKISGNVADITGSNRAIYINVSNSGESSIDITNNKFNGGSFGIIANLLTDGFIEGNYFRGFTQQAINLLTGNYLGEIRNNTFKNCNYAILLNAQTTGQVYIYDNVLKNITNMNQSIQAPGNPFILEPINNAQGLRGFINKRTFVLRNTPPASGAWVIGDEAYVVDPGADDYVLYKCISGGTPGIWRKTSLLGAL